MKGREIERAGEEMEENRCGGGVNQWARFKSFKSPFMKIYQTG